MTTNKEPWFISDTHYGHENIIRYCNRPFSSVDEMDEVLISNWNAKIGPQDIVYFLGDFAFAHQTRVRELLKVLNGNLYLCRGNHDKPLNSFHSFFTEVFDLKTIHVMDDTAPNGKQPVVLCHFPLLSFDRQFHGSIHLHGHCHGNIAYDNKVRRVDVGVDNWNYSPVSYSEIKQFLSDNYKG